MKNRYRMGISTLGLLLVALSTLTPVVYGMPETKDSTEVTGLLEEAKTEALQLKRDAEEMKTFTRSQMSWHTHAAKVEEIKQHVNKSGELLTQLTNAKSEGSPWQQQAVDRIEPLLKDLAASVEGTIDNLSQHSAHLRTAPYRDYVDANADLAGSLAQVISDYVEYGKTKARSEELGAKLEAAGN